MQSNIFTSVLLPLALAIVMLGMGLSLVAEDFKRITRDPKAVAVGTICQLLLLPLIGVLITLVVPMQPEIAVGLIVLAVCPGGPSSNLITYLAKGDVALSVTLTALSSIATVFTIPIFTNLALQYFLGQSAAIALPIGQTMLQIFLITLLPTAIGMAIRHQFPDTARRLEKQMSRLAIGLLALIIVLLLVREGSKLPGFLVQVGIGVVLLNLLATLAGFLVGKLFRLPLAQQICIAIEVGIQNGTLAIAITAGLLNNPDMAVPAAVYSLLMYVTGFGSILYGRQASSRA
ncbi:MULTISPECIES: bile acid:sodium symporter family protein [Leptolyngbya]|uniref:Bile acid:sodium symporter family protein n=1 Tax=Leptolyngbya boryana CZ1 TaxID=3060204 RepID=A0AA97ARP9_LEPBY|nr:MULTISPECIES: bile acid:sodium symporter family protein [Leptolyngbya]MCY6489764.1 bile acid:sodium symporter family protein [Leptolyngbya sp. GGD]WNZ47662.1 bile acid:sodium symporter family protein [Leptolyngbya boryana CZ1]